MLKPAHDCQFHGKWLISYEPAEFTYLEILTLLPTLQTRLEQQKSNYKFLNINFNQTIPHNRYFPVGDHLFVRHNGSDGRLIETDPGAFAIQTALEPLAKPIHSVNLLFPRLASDPRWKTMGLPAAQLFIASSLQDSGFETTPLSLILPVENPPAGMLTADLAGFTLFEDLLPVLMPFLAQFKTVYSGWLAAGGPFLTLAPMAAIYHLPQINLFVRGEAEQTLTEILKNLNRGNLEKLFLQSGFVWQQPGLIVISNFDRVNRPETFNRFQINFNFLKPEHIKHGLEMNFSRGCKRGCVFCCRVQGRKFRKLPLDKAEELLKQYRDKVDQFSDISRGVPLERPGCITESAFPDEPERPAPLVADKSYPLKRMICAAGSPLPLKELPVFFPMNINDDDILQDPDYANKIFNLIKKNGFRIFGIQTSPAALIQSNELVNAKVLDLAADPELYVDSRPLLWLGTDVFLKARASRLGKVLPAADNFFELLGELEKRGIHHYHYWISSDNDSTWEEFSSELILIIDYYRNFPNFGLLAHAPFIVPYPASRLFQHLHQNSPKLKVNLDLAAADTRFRYSVIKYMETVFPNLNSLLRNEKAGGEAGFFDFLKARDFKAAAQLAYHFLKQEQLQTVDINRDVLMRASERMSGLIESMI